MASHHRCSSGEGRTQRGAVGGSHAKDAHGIPRRAGDGAARSSDGDDAAAGLGHPHTGRRAGTVGNGGSVDDGGAGRVRGVEDVEERDGAEREVRRHEDERLVVSRGGDRGGLREHLGDPTEQPAGHEVVGGRQPQRPVALAVGVGVRVGGGVGAVGRRVRPEDEQRGSGGRAPEGTGARATDERCLAPGHLAASASALYWSMICSTGPSPTRLPCRR